MAWTWLELTAPPRRNGDLSAVLEPDAAWFAPEVAARHLALLSPLHRARLDGLRASGEPRIGAAYRRVRVEKGVKSQRLEVRFDGLAGCLRTPAGGSSRQLIVEVSGGATRLRRMTGREAARLMGLDDAYRLPVRDTAALKLAGDAVAVPVVAAIGDQLLGPRLGLARAAA